ncbi:outer membrane lipoprotein-sorting protein [Thalassomonas viridans]|uniref:Outer membrane lipoprotein-sorting protein n=1 Tax=Thalassomonas viridans TaxID=137584 RepID=A0AAF0CAF0_9GAMM|nr:outer membrane lipoprotein-sorting protein [Thalassomonas viridans]WDE08502.1 outer membrane lipoprotein-sorting protein [Thalassomonas viridans]
MRLPNTKIFNTALLAVTIAGSLLLPAHAQSPQEKGLAIAVEADKRDLGFGDVTASMEMILRNQYGEEVKREMRNKTMEQDNDGDKSLIVFDNPRDVKGSAFLSFTHKNRSDDQWLYLPALKRVKRIASSNKSGPFMGSEFAFEDISSQEVEKYSYNYLRDETLDGREHFVIERDPVDAKSGYARQVAWIDKDEYRTWKVDFYDRKNELLKTLKVSGYNQYLNKYWRADSWLMTNHQTQKETVLNFSNYVFNNGFTDRDFNKNSLKRAK